MSWAQYRKVKYPRTRILIVGGLPVPFPGKEFRGSHFLLCGGESGSVKCSNYDGYGLLLLWDIV